MLNQLKHVLHSKHLKMLYYAIFNSHLSYGCLLWANTKKSNLKKLQKLQNKAIKAVNHGKKTSFINIGILNIDNMYTQALCKFMHRVINNKISNTIQSFFILIRNVHRNHTITRQASIPHTFRVRPNSQMAHSSFLRQSPLTKLQSRLM